MQNQSVAPSGRLQTVAVMSTGEMGSAIGRVLRNGGLRVITCLRGRSERTRTLAAGAGIEDVPDDVMLVQEADVLLAVLVPAEATALAERIAHAVETTGPPLLYADLNAIAPQTVRTIGARLTAAGAQFVDAGIIGGPPRVGQKGPRVYASGEHAASLARLCDYGLDVRPISAELGQASALKMCYGALTKGTTALGTALLVAAEALGLHDALSAELAASQPALLAVLERSVPSMPPKAYRWVGEMEEIAATFGAVGLTPRLLGGAADVYRFVAGTSLGKETPEQRTRGTTLEDVVSVLAQALPAVGPAEVPWQSEDAPQRSGGTEGARE